VDWSTISTELSVRCYLQAGDIVVRSQSVSQSVSLELPQFVTAQLGQMLGLVFYISEVRGCISAQRRHVVTEVSVSGKAMTAFHILCSSWPCRDSGGQSLAFPTEVRAQTQVIPCGICVVQSGTDIGFPLPVSFHKCPMLMWAAIAQSV
jgi:hypothetical protein